MPSDFHCPIEMTSMLQMNDPNSPFLYDAVNSKKADPPGLRSGEFMANNGQLANETDRRRKLLATTTGLDISVTIFQNWATSVYNLMMYFKPKTRDEVSQIITAVKNYNSNVGDDKKIQVSPLDIITS